MEPRSRAERVAMAFGARQVRRGQWRCRCPLHKGQSTTSLSITEADDGTVLVYCHSGICDTAEVLRTVGLSWSDLFPANGGRAAGPRREVKSDGQLWKFDGLQYQPAITETQRSHKEQSMGSGSNRSYSSEERNEFGKVVAEYLYLDESGELRFVVTRHDPKTFRPWRPLEDGRWQIGMGNLEVLPYRLRDILEHDRNGIVYVPEGEKDVDRLADLGLVATCNPFGADKWEPCLNAYFQDLDVVVIQDNDEAGRSHAAKVANSLTGIACSVKVLTLPGLPEKGDISDWLDAGHTIEELQTLSETAPIWESVSVLPKDGSWTETNPTLRFRTAREILESTPEAPLWICEPWVAAEAITELAGAPKIGKSEFALAMVHAVIYGEDFLDWPTTAGPVVYLTEQPDASLRQALARAGLSDSDDLHLLSWADTRGRSWDEIVSIAVAYAHSLGARLLAVDTLPQFAGLHGDAENSAGSALEAVGPLQLAAASGLGVLIVRHERKGGGEPGEASRGSSAFTGAVDIVVSIRRSEGNTAPTVRRLQTISRFSNTPPEVVIQLTEDGFVFLGDGSAMALLTAQRQVLEMLPSDEGAAMAEKELLEIAKNLPDTTAGRAIRKLLKEGAIARTGGGKKGSPYRYWRLDPVPASTSDATQLAADRDGVEATTAAS